MRKELRAQGLIEEAEHTFTRLEKLNLTKAQREDAINYQPGQFVEFHRRAAGGFKSGEQWQVIGSQGRKEIVVERNGERRFLPPGHAGKFSLFRAEPVALSVSDTVRITSVPVESFSQANEAQFYVSMSRARKAMHLFTDSKVALREAVTRKSARLSPWELIAGGNGDHTHKELLAKLVRASSGQKKINGHNRANKGRRPGSRNPGTRKVMPWGANTRTIKGRSVGCWPGRKLGQPEKPAHSIRRRLKGASVAVQEIKEGERSRGIHSMQTIDKETEQLIKRIERAVRTAKLQRLSQEEYCRRYYQLNLPEREQEVEIER